MGISKRIDQCSFAVVVFKVQAGAPRLQQGHHVAITVVRSGHQGGLAKSDLAIDRRPFVEQASGGFHIAGLNRSDQGVEFFFSSTGGLCHVFSIVNLGCALLGLSNQLCCTCSLIGVSAKNLVVLVLALYWGMGKIKSHAILSEITPGELARFDQFSKELGQMGVANCVGGWCASDLSRRDYVVARTAILSRKPKDLLDVAFLEKLKFPGETNVEIMQHALSMASRGCSPALTWAKMLAENQPWVLSYSCTDHSWLARLLVEQESRTNINRRWGFVWNGMAERWISGSQILKKDDMIIGSGREVVCFAIVAALAGNSLKLSHESILAIEKRLVDRDWEALPHAEFVEQLHVRCRHALLMEASAPSPTHKGRNVVSRSPKM